MIIQALLVLFVFILIVTKKYLWITQFASNLFKEPAPPVRRYDFNSGGDLLTEIGSKWTKPYHTLPVHVDIPRLARKIAIYANGDGVLSAQSDDKSAYTQVQDGAKQDYLIIRDIIVTLSKVLGEPKTQQDNITERFPSFFGTGDPSLSLNDFLEQVVGANSKVVNVLKACNQSILAPGVLKLKFTVGNAYPFKDMRGSWRIDIHVDDDKLCVTHLKRERSFEDDPADYFEFEWSLKLIFDKDAAQLQEVLLHIDDLSFGNRMGTKKKDKIQEVMTNFSRTKL